MHSKCTLLKNNRRVVTHRESHEWSLIDQLSRRSGDCTNNRALIANSKSLDTQTKEVAQSIWVCKQLCTLFPSVTSTRIAIACNMSLHFLGNVLKEMGDSRIVESPETLQRACWAPNHAELRQLNKIIVNYVAYVNPVHTYIEEGGTIWNINCWY